VLELSTRQIVRAIADAAERWSDADFPPRVRATEAIATRTGYSVPVVEFALDQLFFSITADELRDTIAAELGSADALDGFVARPGKPDGLARGVGRVCVISSRTTIGVALIPALFALCAKCEVTVKDREDDFIGAFFETLAQEHEAFAKAARAQQWTGARSTVDLRAFDAVVAFGKSATLADIRTACAPEARFIPFGSRASAGYLSAQALASPDVKEIARGAARDLLLYDTEGCLSLHVLFVESQDDKNVRTFLDHLAVAAGEASIEFPRGACEPAALAAAGTVRNVAAFRAASGRGAVYSDDACSFVIAYDPPREDPPAFAPRALGVIPVSGPQEAVRYLRGHGVELEAVSLADGRDDVIAAMLDAGAVRLAPFGELQRPPVSSNHGGRPRIADFIRWIDREF
jgi:hypothetical protein